MDRNANISASKQQTSGVFGIGFNNSVCYHTQQKPVIQSDHFYNCFAWGKTVFCESVGCAAGRIDQCCQSSCPEGLLTLSDLLPAGLPIDCRHFSTHKPTPSRKNVPHTHILRLQSRYDQVQSRHVLRSLFLNKLCLEIQTPLTQTHIKNVFGYAF